MAAAHLLPLTLTKVAAVVQMLNLGLLLAVLALVRRLAGRLSSAPGVVAGSCVATVLCAPVATWALQGSDSGFVSVWLLVAVIGFAHFEQHREAWPAWFCALLGLGILIRPDVGLYSIAILIVGLTDREQMRTRLLRAGTSIAIVVLSLLLFGQLYYGDPLPNTYYLKATGSPPSLVLSAGLANLLFLLPYLAAPLILATYAVLRQRRDRTVLLCGALIATALLYSIWIGGDWATRYGNRFLAPVLPLLLILAVMGARGLLDRYLVKSLRASAWPGVGLVLVAAVLAITSSTAASRADFYQPSAPTMYWKDNLRNYRHAAYLREQTAPSLSIAVHWAGVLPYFSRRPAIDVLGRSDRHIARLTVPRFYPGHSKWDWDYVLNERRPDMFLIDTRGLSSAAQFKRDYFLVVKNDSLRFYLRRDALIKLRDLDVRLIDLKTGSALENEAGA